MGRAAFVRGAASALLDALLPGPTTPTEETTP